MTTITNFIQFDTEDFAASKAKGRISTLTQDIDFTAVPFQSQNPNAPTHRIFAKSPRGFELEVGAIWEGRNQSGGTKWTLIIRQLRFNANLGRFPGQDDPTLQAIIQWEPRED